MTIQEPELVRALTLFSEGVQDALGGNLLGIYITGSLLMDDFEPSSSDIDFLVVMQEPLCGAEAARLIAFHDVLAHVTTWGSRFEGGYAARTQLRAWGIEGAMAAIEPGEALRIGVPSNYTAEDMVALRDYCSALYGPDPAEVIPLVDRASLDAALRDYLAELLARTTERDAAPERLADTLLNSARCLFGLRMGRPCTKREAVAWLADEKPEIAPALTSALAVRRGVGEPDAAPVLAAGFTALVAFSPLDTERV
jgi:hypothetical protein